MGVQGDESVLLVNVQVPSFTPEEVAAAEAEQVKRAGPLVIRIRERAEEVWQLVRAELNARAGGEASARTSVLAHYALMSNRALELQALLAEATAGSNGKDPDKAFRSLAGLSVVAADLLNKAYAAATEEGAAKAKAQSGGPVGELMGRLGVTPGVGAEVPGHVPFDRPAPVDKGAPPPKNPTSSRKKPPSAP